MIRIGDQDVVHGEVAVSGKTPFRVEGPDIIAVHGPDQEPFERQAGAFYPPGGLWDRIRQTTGELTLHIQQPHQIRKVRVFTDVGHLTEEQQDQLRRELGHLALSFEQSALKAAVYASSRPAARTAGSGAGVSLPGLEHLYRVLEQYLPELLDNPLRARGFSRGPVPIHRAPPTPRNLIARRFRPDLRTVTARRSADLSPEGDYAWLQAVVRLVSAQLSSAARLEANISDLPQQGTGLDSQQLQRLQKWLGHPLLNTITTSPPEFPSWTLSRSVPGAAILEAWQRSGMGHELSGSGLVFETADRLMRLPVARDSHLYELWVLLSVVEVLRRKFRFVLVDDANSLEAYARYSSGRWAFAPIRLRWEGHDPFGLPLYLNAEVLHEPQLATRSGAPRTPDVVLRLSGGAEGEGRTTTHILDAKLRKSPRRQARLVARDHYLNALKDRPMSAYVALPGESADLSGLVRGMSRADALSTRTIDSVTGFAWGCLQASPDGESFGIRQFVTLALQYHRWELRHLCSNCGGSVGRGDMTLRSTRMEQQRGLTHMEDAHRDTLRDGRLLIRGRLTYRCQSCAHRWSRQACRNGHLLMKHGRLTPHPVARERVDDPDYDVVCGICKHSMGRG